MHITLNSRSLACAVVVLLLVGCSTQSHRAPVEERSRNGSATSSTVPKVFPGAENAGKPGYYTVKPGDTLIRISLETGQNWRDLAAWNGLDNPNLIEAGQTLRVAAPAESGASASAAPVLGGTKPIAAPKIDARAVDSKTGVVVASAPKSSASAASVVAPSASQPASAAEVKDIKDTSRDTDEPAWQWPANGPVVGGFEEGKRKGVAIGGKSGDPVFAAADGTVVYAGSGLRGYGKLVIIKHNAEYLTAYAHNQALLVKEDQTVRKGQKIAEMGSTDAERVQLHFEMRKQGKPVDPARQLPVR